MAIELHHLHPGHDDELLRLKSRIADLERMDTEHTLQIAKMNGYISHLEEERRWRKCSEELPQNGQDVWAYDSKSKSVLHLEYEKSDEGEGFIVFPYMHAFLQNITQWLPFEKPKAPKEDK